MKLKKGFFITIYGINNIGKTYHATRLVRRLKALGKDAVYIKYPVYDQKPTGPFLNSILRAKKQKKMPEEELQLWFVLNRYQFQPKLEKWLRQGKIVVAEDYSGTGIAWGAAKGGNLAELEQMNKFLVQEDVAILMEGKRVLKAREKGHIHEEDDALTSRCASILRKLAGRYRWKRVAISTDRDITAARLWRWVAPYLQK